MTDLVGRGIDPSLMHVDRLIAAVADRQHEIVARAQLVELGLERGAIGWRINRGVLHPLHRGVYVWGHPTPTAIGRAVAAVYACGEGSALSHHAAAARWEIRPEPDRPIDVTIAGRRRVRQPGIQTHETRSLSVIDTRTLHGIPVTSPARTLLDITPDLAIHDLATALEQAQIDRLVTKRDIDETIARAPGRAGKPALRALVAEPAFTRSKAERILVALLSAAKLPRPAFNHTVEGLEVDAVWRIERVVLEFDSHRFHATRAAFERDRRRDAILTRAGYLVLRTTWTELTEHPHALVARIAEALALSRSSPPRPCRSMPRR